MEKILQGKILFTPGHTADSISLKVKNVIFCGDAAMNDFPSIKRLIIWIENIVDFEKSWDEADLPTEYEGWKVRRHGSRFEVSLMCGLWQKDKLLKVLERDCDPWTIEEEQMGYGFDYYINSGEYIIDWGYRTFIPCNIMKGKWTKECKEFLESEGIEVDYNKKGFM